MTKIIPVLEPAAQEFADATAKPPFLFDLSPEEGRKTVDSVQDGDIPAPPAGVTDLTIAGGPSGEVSIKIYRPAGAVGVLPVVLFTHGAGWVFGDAHTHGRLVKELTSRAVAATVFTNYSLSPEARYPTAIEEIYAALEWIAEHGAEHDLDPARIAVAGDSVGGNMTAAITIMAKQRRGPRIAAQVLYYPVTDASFDTDSGRRPGRQCESPRLPVGVRTRRRREPGRAAGRLPRHAAGRWTGLYALPHPGIGRDRH
ncbi:MAG TPA: alpha/beta hydrolase [Trebonia sp.]